MPEPGDDRLTFVEGEALGFVLQRGQPLPQLAPGIKRTQGDQALLIRIRPAAHRLAHRGGQVRRAAGP